MARHQKNLAMVLASVGWEIRELTIDIAAQHAVVRLHRWDGRWIYVDYSPRGAVVERWHTQTKHGKTKERKPIPWTFAEDEFLGRVKCPEVRSALREMCNYVAPGRCGQVRGAQCVDLRHAIELRRGQDSKRIRPHA